MKFILTYLVLSILLSGCSEKREQNIKETEFLSELQKYKSQKIELYLFEYGVSYSSNIITTKLSDRDFHQKQVKKIKSQTKYKNNTDT